MRKTIHLIAFILLCSSLSAQGEQASTGFMRSHLKMYVVVAVLLIIFSGIIAFLLSLERRLKKLEDNSN
jgi:heme/copper-type cytochrome/quinol oxidase subunit 4